MAIVQLPVSRLRRYRVGPGRCARHGRPATEQHRVRIVRRPAGRLGRLGGPLLASALTLPSDPVVTPQWPFCPECRADRSLRLTAGAAMLVAALLPAAALAITAPLVTFAGAGPTALTVALCVALVAGGLGLVAAASWPVLSRASISRDGAWLLVEAHPLFAEEALHAADDVPAAMSPIGGHS